MNKLSNKKLTSVSRMLRNNMTKEEKRLWYDFFKKLPVTVKRQKIIGKYIVDFCVADARLVVELDGSQHYDNENQIVLDFERDEYLKSLGFTVLRYSNLDIQRNFKVVCEDILSRIDMVWNNA